MCYGRQSSIRSDFKEKHPRPRKEMKKERKEMKKALEEMKKERKEMKKEREEMKKALSSSEDEGVVPDDADQKEMKKERVEEILKALEEMKKALKEMKKERKEMKKAVEEMKKALLERKTIDGHIDFRREPATSNLLGQGLRSRSVTIGRVTRPVIIRTPTRSLPTPLDFKV